MLLSPGDKLGPYEIIAPIGKGGMGEVWKAHDPRLNRDVAIKVSVAQFSERFEREAKAIAALNHPNICQIYDVGPNYLVMEYIVGTPLKGPLPVDQAQKYAAQICDALDAAHKKGITHRDLKPANILATKSGIKLLDFGLAKLATASKGESPKPDDATLMALTGKNEIVGTLYYMSPEQLQAQSNGQEIDSRSDIFSFGLVLYEMLTGKRAFEGSSPASVIAAIMEHPAPSIADIAPPALDHVLKTCLAKDRDERWQTARDLKRELEWITATSEPQNTAPISRDTKSQFGRLPWIAAGVLAVTTMVALWAPWRTERPAELKPLMRLDVSLGPDAITGPVAISPDGTRIVFPIQVKDKGTDGKQLLATRLLGEAAITRLPGTENGGNPFFSPDGQSIGFTADSKLKKVSLRAGAPVTLADITNFFGASWGENGNIVAQPLSNGGLKVISDAGGSLHLITKPDKLELHHYWPQVLPGANAVLFTVPRHAPMFDDGSVKAVTLNTGAVKTVLDGGYFGRYLATNGSTGHLVYVRQGGLYAVGFDPAGLKVQGSAAQILDDVAVTATNGFDVSRNGTFVYRPGTATDQKTPVTWLDNSGKSEPLVTTAGHYYFPRFSPDGKRLAMAVDTGKGLDIAVFDRQKQDLSRLTFGGAKNQSPVWSPDGAHVAFESRTATTVRINWIRADGYGEVQVLLESDSMTRPSGFSPDGRRLAYHEIKPEGESDLWTLPLDTSDPEHPKPGKPVAFLQTPASESGLVFSPDDRFVAYHSTETGRPEIYVRPAPGSDGKPGPGKWQISTGGGSWPQWSPNGRELLYQSRDGHIMVTEYKATTAGSFSSSKPHAWSERLIRLVGTFLSFALAADGKRVAMFPLPEVTAEDKGPAHVTFLLNFFDELRRKVPAVK